ncbi:MAG: transcriptional regulator [Thermovibrio sp.]|nr:MAG: transcriptional regulator [Thermovibrio sp.]
MEKLLSLLRGFSPSDIEEIERRDRQYKALEKLYEKVEDKELFFKLVILNALLSYQLQTKGETYWENFSKFFSENPSIDKFSEFLSKFNRRFLQAKLKRFKRAKECVDRLFEKYSLRDLGENLLVLVDELSKCMNQRRDSKTIVFSAKMFMYGYKIVFGEEPKNLEKIEIPLDSRLKKIFPELKTWRELSSKLKIPPVKLDALVWVPMGLRKGDLEEYPEELREKILELKRKIERLGT